MWILNSTQFCPPDTWACIDHSCLRLRLATSRHLPGAHISSSAVTSHDPGPAAPPSSLNDTSSAISQPLLQTYSQRLSIQLYLLVPASVPAALQSPAPIPSMRTHLQDGIQKPKLHTDGTVIYPLPRALLTVVEHTEPTCFSQATKHTEWRDAMTKEIIALLKNHTWSLDFHQHPGIDYAETFSPVVKPATIRTVLSLAVSHGHFDIKDLGPLNYFLGLQVLHKDGTLHINQLKYAHDLLQKANLLNSKPAYTPLAAKVLLSVFDGALISNPTEYRELVGSLQYLTLTRSDISFAVNTVAQFMNAHSTSHLVAAKRILRYIKDTIDLGLTFTPQTAIARWVPQFSSIDHWICDYSWN
ncbi:unnamed protein product [Prunus brigantina]